MKKIHRNQNPPHGMRFVEKQDDYSAVWELIFALACFAFGIILWWLWPK